MTKGKDLALILCPLYPFSSLKMTFASRFFYFAYCKISHWYMLKYRGDVICSCHRRASPVRAFLAGYFE